MAKTLSVAAIKEGTVIDHIPAGNALKIVRLLGLESKGHRISIGIHLTSKSIGTKDLIKIENHFLSEEEARYIAIFAPEATISLIKNYKVASKMCAKLPKTIEKVLVCPNPRCVTNHEPLFSRFNVEEHKHRVLLHCCYCEKMFARDEIKEYA